MDSDTEVAREIVNASAEWRSALIDVSGSNRLLYFRPNASTINVSAAPPAAIAKLVSGSTVRLSELFPNTTDLRAAQRACMALSRKQREASEEFGVSVAFLAVGLASWNPEADEAIAAAPAEELNDKETKGHRPKYNRPSSPVLLRPLELNLRRGAQDAWELRLDEDFQLNGVLEHVMNSGASRLDSDEVLLLDESSLESTQVMLDSVETACSDVTEFAIDRSMFLGAFSYLKQPMVEDIDDLTALAKSDLVLALAGDPMAAARVRAIATEITESQPDYSPIDSEFLVLDADSSQSFVVNAALSGRNLVVEGPPGTGKSQTIANVIASMVAAGKKVLFVAQKRAAVEAVLNRLGSTDLSHLVLDLFASTGSRRFVSEELRKVLDRQKAIGIPDVAGLHFRLTASRDRLVAHRDALYDSTRGWGASVAELRVMSAAIPRGARSNLRLPAAVFNSWTKTSLEQLGSALNELNSIGALEPTWASTPGWSPSAMISNDLVANRTNLVREVATTTLPLLQQALSGSSAEAGFAAPRTLVEADAFAQFLGEVRAIASTIPAALSTDITTDDLEQMLIALDRQYRKHATLRLGWGARRAAARRATEIGAALQRPERFEWLKRARNAKTAWTAAGIPLVPASFGRLESALSHLRTQLATVQASTQGLDFTTTPLSELPSLLYKLAAQPNRVRMPRAFELEQQLVDAGVARVVATIRHHFSAGKTLSCKPSDVLEWVAVRSTLEEAEMTDPALAGITGQDLNSAAEMFQSADVSNLDANAARIRRFAAEALKESLDIHPEEHSILKHEVTRKRNFRPIRKLFREAPHVMLAAKPVWAMSPLQVSRLLPPEECFDVVIFDEASQVKPADAIPSLLRARQAIIAGDSRQLPPTEFFSKVLEDVPNAVDEGLNDMADNELAPLGGDAPKPQVRRPSESFTRDAESILFAMDRVLAGQSRRLLWHYRSRDERLIATSNAHIYDWSLTTFPAADTPDALRHVPVEWSKGIGGKTNSPEAEVAEVVSLVRRHVSERPDETLGVITFGVAHQNRIEASLEEAARGDDQLRAWIFGDRDERFFVKSIERVQGDERDAIILTVGYGKGVDGKLRYFWGPLLQDGGERRLNVAISRARRRMTLVTSFGPDDVPEDGHHSPGFKLMYQFIRFMASNGRNIEGGPDRSLALNPFEIDIRDRLSKAGLTLDPQVGVGSYRIDFAARHPELPGKHVLAIEADGASYHAGHTARERDRLRQTLLERRGWRFHRIWSSDWFNDADGEVEKVIAAFEEAVAAAGSSRAEERAVPAPEPSWKVEPAARTLAKPQVYRGQPIGDYSGSTLVELVEHLRSDRVLRTEEEEFNLVMAELGFQKRGSRIVAAIQQAQATADRRANRKDR